MRDARKKINDGEDPELNFLNRDFLRNNLQFSVFPLQLFSENKTQPTQFIEITTEEIKRDSKQAAKQTQKHF
jgi:hypothetical protein